MGRRTLLLLASILVAAAGTALIWVYVQNADDRAKEAWQTVVVLQATATIEAGSGAVAVKALTAKKDVPRGLVPDGAISDASQLIGRAAVVTVLKGQFILKNQFDAVGAPSGVTEKLMAVSVNLPDPNRVAGLLHPGLDVAVYYVAAAEGKTQSQVKVLIPKVRVLGVGNTTVVRNATGKAAQLGTQGGVAAANVILQVDHDQAKQLIMATTTGTLWFTVLGSDAAQPPPRDSITSDQLLTQNNG